MILFMMVILFIIIYFVIQNNKVQHLFDLLTAIDEDLDKKLMRYTRKNAPVDVYMIHEIRSMMTKDYIHLKKIDDFRIYKESLYKIKLIIKLGVAVQVLEWKTNEKIMRLRETPILRSDLELLRK